MLCKCGCRTEVSPRARGFVRGHNLRIVNPADSLASRLKMSRSHSLLRLTERHKANIGVGVRIANSNDRSISERRSESLRLNWREYKKDPERSRLRLLPALRAMNTYGNGRMTRPERIFNDLAKVYNLPFRYNSREVCVAGYFPDFIHRTSKLLVEIFGTAWHEETEESFLAKAYSSVGYRLFVIWDKELYEDPDLWVATRVGIWLTANTEPSMPVDSGKACVETRDGAAS